MSATVQPGSSARLDTAMREGRVILPLPSGDSRVFYNPRMNLNRDLAILFAMSYFPAQKQVRVCDPMTGSGVRAARYVLESHNVREVIASDADEEAVRAAERTIESNELEGKVRATVSDAIDLLARHSQDRLDLIDLDPFGSPAPFFESALRATIDGGIVAATATDMGPLTGARPAACYRKYGAIPVRCEFEKEIAVRLLAGCLARTACQLDLGIEIAFSHASDHYSRVYASVSKGKTAANQTVKQSGFLEYCPQCLMRQRRDSLAAIQTSCANCKSRVVIGGPIWLGSIWDGDTVHKMVQGTPTLASTRLSELQTLLSRIVEEVHLPAFYYRTDAFARTLRIKPPRLAGIIDRLRGDGYKASRTQFDPNAFRTDAPFEKLIGILDDLAKKA